MNQYKGDPPLKFRRLTRYIAELQGLLAITLLGLGLLKNEFSWLLGIACLVLVAGALWNLIYLPALLKDLFIQYENKGNYQGIRLLSHYRHDVMNQVQLLKGYIQLKKYDRLNGPLQKLIMDARRQTDLSNLPGTLLPYSLLNRDLSSPMLRIAVEIENDAKNLTPRLERNLLDRLIELADTGENQCQELGISVDWRLLINDPVRVSAFTLHVLGEQVNDTYIDQLIKRLHQHNWLLRNRVQEGETYILSFES